MIVDCSLVPGIVHVNESFLSHAHDTDGVTMAQSTLSSDIQDLPDTLFIQYKHPISFVFLLCPIYILVEFDIKMRVPINKIAKFINFSVLCAVIYHHSSPGHTAPTLLAMAL